MKSIVIITAHCDNQEKIDTLIECINELKSQGYPIIVSSHIKVPDIIYDMVDYVIYDKENPLIYNHEFDKLNSSTWFWTLYDGFYQEYTLDFNHAYAVLKLMKNGVAISKINGYDISHIICYDYLIKDKEVLIEHIESLEDNDVFSYYFEGAAKDGITPSLISFKNDVFINCFESINSKKEYSEKQIAIFEEFLQVIFINNSVKIIKKSIESLREKNTIDKFTNIGDMSRNIFPEKGFLFLSKVENNFFIYFISFLEKSSINLEIKGKSYILNSIQNKSYLIPITEDDLVSGIKIKIPEFNLEDIYNLDSRFSIGRIDYDNNLIVNLEYIECKIDENIIV